MRQAMPLIGSALWLICQGAAADEAKARRELEAEHARLMRAYRSKDVHAIVAACAPGFAYKTESGKVLTARDAERAIRDDMAKAGSIITADSTIQNLTLKGTTAVVVTRTRITAMVTGRDGRRHSAGTVGSARETWVRTPSGWRVKSYEELSSIRLLDGRPAGTSAQQRGPAGGGRHRRP